MRALWLVLLLVVARSAGAQEVLYPEEEPPVVERVGTLVPRSLFSSVVLDEDLPWRWGWMASDVLRGVPGIWVTGISDTQHLLAVRGLMGWAGASMEVYVDGQKTPVDFWGVQDWSVLGLFPEVLRRVEIYRTPGPLYGRRAFLGALHLETRDPEPGFSVKWLGGAGGEGGVYGGWLWTRGSQSWKVSGWWYGVPAWNRGAGRTRFLNLRTSWKDARRGWTGRAWIAGRRGDTFVPLARRSMETESAYLSAQLQRSWRVGGRRGAFGVSLSRVHMEAPRTDWNPRMGSVVTYLQAEYHEQRPAGRGVLRWSAEVERQHWSGTRDLPSAAHPTGYREKAVLRRTGGEGFLTATVDWMGDAWGGTLQVGGRAMRWRGRLLVEPFAAWLWSGEREQWRLGWAQMRRTPGIFERYADILLLDEAVLLEFKGNPGLRSERISMWEVGWERALGRAWVRLTGFRVKARDLVYRDYDREPSANVTEILFFQGRLRRVWGLEAELLAAPWKGWRLQWTASWLHYREPATERPFPRWFVTWQVRHEKGRQGWAVSLGVASRTRWDVGRVAPEIREFGGKWWLGGVWRWGRERMRWKVMWVVSPRGREEFAGLRLRWRWQVLGELRF